MHIQDQIGEMERRAEAMRLTLTDLARRAGVHPSTVSKLKTSGRDARHSTLTRLEEALTAEELRLLTYLAALHPGHAPAEAGT